MKELLKFRKVCYVVVNLRERRLFQRLRKGLRNVKTYVYCESAEYITIAVMMAKRIHLFPFRTQKLSSFTPKVLVSYYREDR